TFGTRYQLVVEQRNGVVSGAAASTPQDFPVVIEYSQNAPTSYAVIEAPVANMGPVAIRLYPLEESCHFWPYQEYPNGVPPASQGLYRVEVTGSVLEPAPSCPNVKMIHLVASTTR